MEPQIDFIEKCVIEAFHELLGDDMCKSPILKSTHPEDNLGLDSFDGVDYACILSKKLSFTIPHKINVFVNDSTNQMRTVGEIIHCIANMIKKENAQ